VNEKEYGAAKKLATKLNTALFTIFALWLALLVLFWARTGGPLRPYDALPFATEPLPWLVASLAGAFAVRLLPEAWFRIGSRDRAMRTYELFGVKIARFVITDGDLVNRIVRRRYPGYRAYAGEASLSARLATGIVGERAHLGFLIFGVGSAACALAGGWHQWAIALTIGNLLVNFYPVLLQRYTRARVLRIFSRRVSLPVR